MKSNFQILKLREVIDVVIDNRGRNPKSYSDSGIPVIDNYLIVSEAEADLSQVKRYIDEDTYSSFIRKYISNGDVLMTLVGNGYGKVAITPEDRCIIIQNTIGLRCNEDNDNLYLYYLLKANREVLMNLNRGAAQPSIKVGDILDLEFKFPPIEVQQKIGSMLGGLDKKSFINTQANQTLEEVAQAIFKSWFVDFDPVKAKMNGEQPEGMDAMTASLFPEKLVESELGLIPEGWEVMGLPSGTLFREGPGILAKDFHEKGVPLIRLAGLKNGVSLLDGCNYLDPEKVDKKWKHFLLQEGDILLSSSASLGRVAEVTKQSENSIAYTGIIGFRPIEGVTTRKYLKYFIQSRNFQRQIEAFGVGSVLKHFGPTHLKKMWILLPPVSIQDKFEQLVLALDEKIQTGLEQNQSLSNLRDTLLPKLLSGEIELGAED